MKTSETGNIRIHPVSPFRLWITPVFIIAMVSFVCIAWWIGGSQQEHDNSSGFITIFSGLGLVLALAMYCLGRYAKLSTSATGITLRQIGPDLYTEWNNIEWIDLKRGVEGIYLRKSCTQSIPKWIRHIPYAGGLTRRQMNAYVEGRFIQLSPFMWRWNGELGREFHRYVPELLNNKD